MDPVAKGRILSEQTIVRIVELLILTHLYSFLGIEEVGFIIDDEV